MTTETWGPIDAMSREADRIRRERELREDNARLTEDLERAHAFCAAFKAEVIALTERLIECECPECGQGFDVVAEPDGTLGDGHAVCCPECRAMLMWSCDVESGDWMRREDWDAPKAIHINGGASANTQAFHGLCGVMLEAATECEEGGQPANCGECLRAQVAALTKERDEARTLHHAADVEREEAIDTIAALTKRAEGLEADNVALDNALGEAKIRIEELAHGCGVSPPDPDCECWSCLSGHLASAMKQWDRCAASVVALRDVLERVKAALGDRLLARGPLSKEYAHGVMGEIDAALRAAE